MKKGLTPLSEPSGSARAWSDCLASTGLTRLDIGPGGRVTISSKKGWHVYLFSVSLEISNNAPSHHLPSNWSGMMRLVWQPYASLVLFLYNYFYSRLAQSRVLTVNFSRSALQSQIHRNGDSLFSNSKNGGSPFIREVSLRPFKNNQV